MTESHSSIIRKDEAVITKPRRHIPRQGAGGGGPCLGITLVVHFLTLTTKSELSPLLCISFIITTTGLHTGDALTARSEGSGYN